MVRSGSDPFIGRAVDVGDVEDLLPNEEENLPTADGEEAGEDEPDQSASSNVGGGSDGAQGKKRKFFDRDAAVQRALRQHMTTHSAFQEALQWTLDQAKQAIAKYQTLDKEVCLKMHRPKSKNLTSPISLTSRIEHILF